MQIADTGSSSGCNGRQMASGMLCLRGESRSMGWADDRNAVTGLPIVYSFHKTGKRSVPSATESW
jgi:hypothetical protein